ncbi:hypothetical protein D3C73_1461140 [compost metagenome]
MRSIQKNINVKLFGGSRTFKNITILSIFLCENFGKEKDLLSGMLNMHQLLLAAKVLVMITIDFINSHVNHMC